MRELRAYLILLGALLVVGIGASVALARAERAVGAAQADIVEAKAEAQEARRARQSAEATADSLRRAFAPQALNAARAEAVYARGRIAALARMLDSLRAVGAPAPETTTVTVTVRDVADAAEAVASCSAALATCRLLAIAESTKAVAAMRETAAARKQLRATEVLARRPWTSAGLAFDARTGALGVVADRDLWRLRFGGTLFPVTPNGAQIDARISVRW